MAKLKIVTYGHEALRTPAQPITVWDANLRRFVQDMFDTMYRSNGVGLAAPQVSKPWQLFILDCSTAGNKLPSMVCINPTIVAHSGACMSYEGCLSFPDVFTEVPRYSHITLRYTDLLGKSQELTTNVEDQPLLTRAIQHEMDHLSGTLFVDRIFEGDVEKINTLLAAKGLPPVETTKLLAEAEVHAMMEASPQLRSMVIS
ncbi:MAG: peptide deformylase [Vampirovibrionales bacterium]